MSAGRAELAALVESDPDVLGVLIEMYLTAYVGGAFTVILNARALPGEPASSLRAAGARVLACDLLHKVQDDPAVMMSLTDGLLASLRGEHPEATLMVSHAGSGS